MPIIKSAGKKLRQSLKHRDRNRAQKAKVKELVDAFKKNPTAKAYSAAVSALDKAAKKNLIHRNKAARLKSRLSKRLPKTEAPKKPAKVKKGRKSSKS